MPLKGKAKKEYQREYMRVYMKVKRDVKTQNHIRFQPDVKTLPQWQVNPNRYLSAHLSVYPEYLELYNAGKYDPDLDPHINPLLRPGVIPNCKDGRYRCKS